MTLLEKIVASLYDTWDTMTNRQKIYANIVYDAVMHSDMTIEQMEERVK